MNKEWKVGDTYIRDDYKYHIVAIIEDNGRTLYIVKYYGKRKQWWHYEVAEECDGMLFS